MFTEDTVTLCNYIIVIHIKASEKLSVLISNNLLGKDLAHLSPSYQTSSLESFHSVLITMHPNPLVFRSRQPPSKEKDNMR